MAVRASDRVTLAVLASPTYVRMYYVLQASALAAPAAPIVNPPVTPWESTEPTYSPGSTTTLYTVMLTAYGSLTFEYGAVQLSASFAAAKEAYNKAVTAENTANGKSIVIRSTSDATPSAIYKDGDQWWKYSGSQVIAMWIHNGTSWVTHTLTSAVITNLDAGVITAGVLNADRIGAQSLTLTKMHSTVTTPLTQAQTDADAAAVLADKVNNEALSRGTDLVTNGTGMLGDNTNFSQFTFTSSDAPTGAAGSFLTTLSVSGTPWIDGYLPVDPNKKMMMSFQARQTGSSTDAAAYAMLVPYDAFKNQISPQHYMYTAGTSTTLAVALNPGDTTVTLTNSVNWYGSTAKPAGTSVHLRDIIWWDYVDEGGKLWAPETYSRNFSGFDLWADSAVVGNVITLRVPYAGPAKAIGTKLSGGSSGGTYMYGALVNGVVPNVWTMYSESITGMVSNGSSATFSAGWPQGVSFAKVGFLVNRIYPGGGNNIGSRHAFAAISFSDASAANSVAATAITNAATAKTQADTAVTNAAAADAKAVIAAAAADTALLLDVNSVNPVFSKWTATYPDGYGVWGSSPVPAKETTITRSGGFAARYVQTNSATPTGMTFYSTLNPNMANVEYVTMTISFYLVSGTLGQTGVLLDWTGMTNNRVSVSLFSEVPSPALGKWYTVSKVLRRPTNATGTFTSYTGFLMASYTSLGGGASVKDIIYDRLTFRPSTVEEITAIDAAAAAATAITNAATADGKAVTADGKAVTAQSTADSVTAHGTPTNRLSAPLTDIDYWTKVKTGVIPPAIFNPLGALNWSTTTITAAGTQLSTVTTTTRYAVLTALNVVPSSGRIHVKAVGFSASGTYMTLRTYSNVDGTGTIVDTPVQASGEVAIASGLSYQCFLVAPAGVAGTLISSLEIFEVIGSSVVSQQSAFLSPAGLRLTSDDGGGLVDLTTNSNNFFTIQKDLGGGLGYEVQASIDANGVGTFLKSNANDDFYKNDIPLIGGFTTFQRNGKDYDGLGMMDWLPRGIVYAGHWASADSIAITTQYKRLGSGSFILEPGRQYQFTLDNGSLQCSNTSGVNQYMELKFATAAMAVGTGGTRYSRSVVYNGATGNWAHTPFVRVAHGAGTISLTSDSLPSGVEIFWQYNSNASSTHTGFTPGQGGGLASLSILDIGPDVISVLSTDNATSGTGAPPPAVTVTKTYSMAWSRSWNNNGGSVVSGTSQYTDAQMMYQGLGASAMGSMMGWNNLGLTGKVASKIEVYLRNRHTYSSGGVTCRFGTSTGGYTIQAAHTTTNPWTKTWTKGAGAWHTIPSTLYTSIMSGSIKSIALGISASAGEYAYFDGVGKSDPPKIRITYK